MKKNVENLLSSFTKIRRFYANELQNKLEKENLTPNEISILILLSNNPSVTTSSQLVYFLQVSKGLVSRSIDGLVKKGLIQCVQDDKDRRVQRIVLTPASKTITIKITNEVRKINDRILKDISEEEALLINPASEEPGDFIEFHQHIIVAKDGNAKGKTTIDVLKLNGRMDLVERRRKRWEEYEKRLLALKVAQVVGNGQLLDIEQSSLASLTDEKEEFTGMFKYQQNNI